MSCLSGTPEFNPTSSTSLTSLPIVQPLKYDTGSVNGTIAMDTVTLGPFTVTQQTFGTFLPPLPPLPLLAWACSFERILKLLPRGKRQVEFTSIHLPSAGLCMLC